MQISMLVSKMKNYQRFENIWKNKTNSKKLRWCKVYYFQFLLADNLLQRCDPVVLHVYLPPTCPCVLIVEAFLKLFHVMHCMFVSGLHFFLIHELVVLHFHLVPTWPCMLWHSSKLFHVIHCLFVSVDALVSCSYMTLSLPIQSSQSGLVCWCIPLSCFVIIACVTSTPSPPLLLWFTWWFHFYFDDSFLITL